MTPPTDSFAGAPPAPESGTIVDVRSGDLMPAGNETKHLSAAQVTAIKNFLNQMKTKAEGTLSAPATRIGDGGVEVVLTVRSALAPNPADPEGPHIPTTTYGARYTFDRVT